MERSQIMLPTELKAKAKKKAAELGISFGEFIRIALNQFLSKGPDESDPLFDQGLVYDGDSPDDLSSNHDAYLYGDA